MTETGHPKSPEPVRSLELRGLSVGVPQGKTLVSPLTITLSPGTKLFLLGGSGVGKTSLLLAVAGLSNLSIQGSATLGSVPCALKLGREVGLMLQDVRGAFNPLLTLESQLLEGAPHPRAQLRARLGTLMERLGLEPGIILRRYPHQLSDGMLRRADLAGVLARRPALILADEPTAGLDPAAARVAWDLLLEDPAQILIAATHDHQTVLRLAKAPAAQVLNLDRPICPEGGKDR